MSTVNVANIQSRASNTPPTVLDSGGIEVGQFCRAWVNFNGVAASLGIRASFNVSSITQAGTGQYTLNFTNALPDSNYAVSGMVGDIASSGSAAMIVEMSALAGTPTTKSTTQVKVRVRGASTGYDVAEANVAIFR